ncbi:MAG: hypothetical protein JXR83_11990 [Deltaproteobacteria bacterium]|nr:hypothetical protein [Deltaproteobacteria bacterium]
MGEQSPFEEAPTALAESGSAEGASAPPLPENRMTPLPGVTSLVNAPPPPAASHDLTPDQLELYVRASIHQDRSPGNVLVVMHPGKVHKVPRNLFAALRDAGFGVTRVDTLADRVRSVEGIRDAFKQLASEQKPIDVIIVSGDGSVDHHLLIAAYWAFYPDLVSYRPGAIDCSAVTEQDLATLPPSYRATFFKHLPDGSALDPTEETIRTIWLLRNRIEDDVVQHRPVARILRRARRDRDDLYLAIAILATLLPHRVVLRPHGFDLSALSTADRESTFKGLYPFLRSVCPYPAGTAADNAVFAGVPGWGYAMWAGLLDKLPGMAPFRRWWEQRVTRAFVRYFLHDSVVVPARLSVVQLDGAWSRFSSHAVGGPGAGHFFTADLTSKTKGMLGYLKRIPQVVIREGAFGSTLVRVVSRDAAGQQKSYIEAQLAEGLYTNRTFIGGVASVTTTDPTSWAGQSSLVVIPPMRRRSSPGLRLINLRGVGGFIEAIVTGVIARLLHMTGFGVGTLAGGGKMILLEPEHQVAIKEGEEIDIDYMSLDRRPRSVPIQISGDPFQAYHIGIRSLWGPLPLLGKRDSLLLASTRRSLNNVRLQQSFRLRGVYIGGVYYFRHHAGEEWSTDFVGRTGLMRPPHYLPRNLLLAQRLLLEAWHGAGAGEFVDTTESGLEPWRRGRFAHNNDQSAHLLLLREPQGTLLVRQVRAMRGHDTIYESRTYYRPVFNAFIIYHSETVAYRKEESPRILQEDHFFRNAEAFQAEAPEFFPVIGSAPGEPTLLLSEHGTERARDAAGQPDDLLAGHKYPPHV